MFSDKAQLRLSHVDDAGRCRNTCLPCLLPAQQRIMVFVREWGREIPAFPREWSKGRISKGTGSGEMEFLEDVGLGEYIAKKGVSRVEHMDRS